MLSEHKTIACVNLISLFLSNEFHASLAIYILHFIDSSTAYSKQMAALFTTIYRYILQILDFLSFCFI